MVWIRYSILPHLQEPNGETSILNKKTCCSIENQQAQINTTTNTTNTTLIKGSLQSASSSTSSLTRINSMWIPISSPGFSDKMLYHQPWKSSNSSTQNMMRSGNGLLNGIENRKRNLKALIRGRRKQMKRLIGSPFWRGSLSSGKQKGERI